MTVGFFGMMTRVAEFVMASTVNIRSGRGIADFRRIFGFFNCIGAKRTFASCLSAIPAVSQKMLIQQLRQMEADGIVRRIVHHQVPPKVEYCLTDWGQALCPALDALLKWAELREPSQ